MRTILSQRSSEVKALLCLWLEGEGTSCRLQREQHNACTCRAPRQGGAAKCYESQRVLHQGLHAPLIAHVYSTTRIALPTQLGMKLYRAAREGIAASCGIVISHATKWSADHVTHWRVPYYVSSRR